MNVVSQPQPNKLTEKNEEWINRKDLLIEVNRKKMTYEANQLRDRRERLGVSRGEMSRLMDVSVSRLSRLERGESIEDIRVIKKYYEFMLDHIKREIDFFNDIRNLY